MARRVTTGEADKPAGDLLDLGRELDRLRRRAARLQRRATTARVDATGDPPAFGSDEWQAWSETIDDALIVVDEIAGTPARDLDGLRVKYRALLWRLTHDDGLLDASRLAPPRIRSRAGPRGGKSGVQCPTMTNT